MKILKYGLLAGLLGLVITGLIEMIGLLPALYRLKGVIQPFIWLCIGWFTGFLVSKNENSLKWMSVIPASLLAGAITGLGSSLSQFALKVYFDSISGIRYGDTMFPSGLDPIAEKWWITIMVAVIVSAMGGSIATLIGQFPKSGNLTQKAPLAKKHFSWLDFFVCPVIGGFGLTGIVIVLYKIFAGNPSGNLSALELTDFIGFLWPYTVIIGMIMGAIIYAGIYLLRTSCERPRRILSILILVVGIVI